MLDELLNRKLTKRELGRELLVVGAVTFGLSLASKSACKSTKSQTLDSEVPVVDEIKSAISGVCESYENIKKDPVFHSLIHPDLKNDAALISTLVGFYNIEKSFSFLNFYEQIQNEKSLDDPSVVLSLATVGKIKGWSALEVLNNHQYLSSLGRSNSKIGAQLLSVAAADEFSHIRVLFDEVAIKRVAPTYELAPLIISAASMSRDLDRTGNNYRDILNNAAGQDHKRAAKMSVISEYIQGDWIKVGSEYTNISVREPDLDENGVMALIFARILKGNKQEEMWEIYDYARELKYDPYLASRLTMLTAVKPLGIDLYNNISRNVYIASDILFNWDLPFREPVQKPQYSLV